VSDSRSDDATPPDDTRGVRDPGDDTTGDPEGAAPEARTDRPVAEALGLTPPSEVGRAALNRARAAALARGAMPGRPVRRAVAGERSRARSGSTPGDGRDPVLLGDTLARLAAERGWRDELSVGGVVGRWREVVGEQIADHCTPELFDDGRLVVRTDSSSWAAQVRLLVPQLLARLEKEVGPDVVREVQVLGPSGPGWVRGQRRVRGRGPRDTYG
jgi:predicted nucleic acid-binding Zn ribbon protein